MKPGKISKRIIIVGGVAGGMSAAARIRRLSETAEIIVFERGGYVSFANCGLPYFLGREIAREEDLILQTPASLKSRFNLDVRIQTEVISINTENRSVSVKNLKNGHVYTESYDDLVLSVGARPIRPPVPGIDLPGIFTLRNLEDVEAIERWITDNRPHKVAIVGSGFIGVEMAEQMSGRGFKVTLIDGADQVLAPLDQEMAALVHSELKHHDVELVLGSMIKRFESDGAKLIKVFAGEHTPIPADMVIVGIGVRPEVEMIRQAGIEIGTLGGIKVNGRMQTSVPHVWAVGDAVEVNHPVSGKPALIALGGPANRQGRVVADNICGRESTYEGSIGTAIVRVFELTVAVTGLNERALKAAGVAFQSVRLHPANHAGYYPGATRLDLKVLFHQESGKLLGAQVIGKDGADKRIDVLATALKAGLDIYDLADLELAYAPPFGSAKDPINLAGMAACNLYEGFVEQADWHQVSDPSAYVLDVRSEKERAAGCVPGSMHIPLSELRDRMHELPDNKPILVYCQSGQRSYFATRQLVQNGFAARNLSGGYLTYRTINLPSSAAATTCA